MLYMVTFTIHIAPMLAYIPYMDPMGSKITREIHVPRHFVIQASVGDEVAPLRRTARPGPTMDMSAEKNTHDEEGSLFFGHPIGHGIFVDLSNWS